LTESLGLTVNLWGWLSLWGWQWV